MSTASVQYNTLPFHFFSASSLYYHVLSLHFIHRGTRLCGVQGGEVKALCTACQITFLMTSLSGFFISEKRKKKQGGEVRGGSILFLVTAKSLIHFFICYLFLIFSFNSCISSFPVHIQMVVITWQIEIWMWGERRCIVGLSAACLRLSVLIVF